MQSLLVAEDVDLRTVCLVIAAMGAQMGSIVAVFVALGMQESKRLRIDHPPGSQLYIGLRDRVRMKMLLHIGYAAMLSLVFSPITVILGITLLVPMALITVISFGLFTFGIFCIALSLFAYLTLEAPFLYRVQRD